MLTEERPELTVPRLTERRRMTAQVQALNADLLSHDSATAVLQSLCDRRDSTSPRIRARKVSIVDSEREFEAIRHQMGAQDDVAVRHRRVDLMCGELVLCRADNWYLPDRLSDEMNAQLLVGETPFGVVVRALGFQRRTLSSKLLFEPLPPEWNDRRAAALEPVASPPEDLLQHKAILQTRDGIPFSLLLETYTKHILIT